MNRLAKKASACITSARIDLSHAHVPFEKNVATTAAVGMVLYEKAILRWLKAKQKIKPLKQIRQTDLDAKFYERSLRKQLQLAIRSNIRKFKKCSTPKSSDDELKIALLAFKKYAGQLSVLQISLQIAEECRSMGCRSEAIENFKLSINLSSKLFGNHSKLTAKLFSDLTILLQTQSELSKDEPMAK